MLASRMYVHTNVRPQKHAQKQRVRKQETAEQKEAVDTQKYKREQEGKVTRRAQGRRGTNQEH